MSMITSLEYADYVYNLTAQSTNFHHIPCNMLHAVIGIAGEAGELLDIIKKRGAYDVPIDDRCLKEEAGDILYYLQMLCNDRGWTLEELKQTNYDKLRLRYPRGFTKDAAVRRIDKIGKI